MIEQHERAAEGEMKVTKGKLTKVSSTVVVGNPEGNTTSPVFSRRSFEDALDTVSRPVKTPDKA
jgi:hypothetical protein